MLKPLLVALTVAAIDAPVTEVTVYSDRARVTRTARVAVSGTQRVALPPLLDRIDISTLRLEVTGAELVRVDLSPLTPDDLPITEARKLLEELERIDDQLVLARSQQAAFQSQSEALLQLQPALPADNGMRPPPKLESAAWAQVVGWISEEASDRQQKARELERKVEALGRERERLVERAAQLGGAERRGGWQVSPTLSGSGTATVTLTYLAGPARWYPTYDLQLDPEKNQVQVAFSGLVSQETGEDWSRARLVLSTAVPSTFTRMPEAATWKLGDKERFIPQPRPASRPVRPPPRAPSLPQVGVDEAAILRERLQERASQSPGEGEIDRLNEMQQHRELNRGRAGGAGRPSSPPPPPPSPLATPQKRSRSHAPSAAPSATHDFNADDYDAPVMSESISVQGSAVSSARRQPTISYSLSPPPSWGPPQLASNLPAMAAGGYDLAWSALQPETVASGKGAVRVALFSQHWPVKVERKLFPALAPEAYLVAELTNPTSSPLPAGQAQLYVGADPAGQARLELVAPSEPFTLPLGLDRAIKVVRNVELVTSEKGLIGTDEVTRYVTTIELANPYPTPVAVKVFDQWPLSPDGDVKIELLETKPWALQDKATGKLEWHLTLPASGKSTAQFTYSIRRPKGWKLYQRN